MKIHHRLSFRTEPYTLTLHLPDNGIGRAAPSASLPSTAAPSERASEPAVGRERRDGSSIPDSPSAEQQSVVADWEPADEPDASAQYEALNGSAAVIGTEVASVVEQREWHDHGSHPRLWPGKEGTAAAAGGPAQSQGWPGCAAPGALLEQPHKLQTWFGVRALLTLAPSSYSRRILNEQVRV